MLYIVQNIYNYNSAIICFSRLQSYDEITNHVISLMIERRKARVKNYLTFRRFINHADQHLIISTELIRKRKLERKKWQLTASRFIRGLRQTQM